MPDLCRHGTLSHPQPGFEKQGFPGKGLGRDMSNNNRYLPSPTSPLGWQPRFICEDGGKKEYPTNSNTRNDDVIE